MGNLILRIAFALSIVAVAIGITAAASDTVARCDPSAVGGVAYTACAPTAGAAAAGAPKVAAAPDAVDRSVTSSVLVRDATGLVALATGLVLVAIFAILLSYRLRPGGVRNSHR